MRRRCSASGRRPSSPRTTLPAADGIDRKGLTAHYELDGSFSDISGRYQHGRTVTGDPTFDAGQIGRAVSFDGDTEVSFGNVGALRSRATRSAWPSGCGARGNLPIAVFQKLDDAGRRRGYEWRLDDIELVGIQRWAARLTITLTSEAPANAIQVRTRERLRLGDWNHVAMTYDGSGKAAGLRGLRQRQAARGRGRARRAHRADRHRRGADARAARRSDRRSSARSTTCVSTAAC